MSGALVFVQSFIASTRQQQGQGLAEYALILMLIAIVVIAALTTLGSTLDTAYYDRLASDLLPG